MELSATGDSDLRRRLNSIEDELRHVSAEGQAANVLHSLLLTAKNDPAHLLALPNRLMVSQPALLKLKEGLVAVQLKASLLLGQMSEKHPQVMAAREEEAEITKRLNDEVAVALRGVEADVRVATERTTWLETQRRELIGRLEKLAGIRPQYSTVLHEVNQRNEAVANARRKLATAQAAEAGAQTASLITFVDSPIAGKDPIGPGRTSIILIGILGGLAVGGAVLFLTVPSLRTPGNETNEPFAASQRGWGLDVPVSQRPATDAILGA
jgi:polysaccharide biosynthesis transport protein